MTKYVIVGLQGQREVEAENVAAALRAFKQTNPGQSVLSIYPAALQRVADQQA